MPPKRRSTSRHATPASPSGGPLLERVADFYHQSMLEEPEGTTCLKAFGMTDRDIIARHYIGYCAGTLAAILPSSKRSISAHGDMRAELRRLGILDADGTEAFVGLVTFPLHDADGGVTGILGLHPKTGRTVITLDPPTALWNLSACRVHSELHLAHSLHNALALSAAGLPNAIGLIADAPDENDLAILRDSGVMALTLWGEKELVTGLAARVSSFDLKAVFLAGDATLAEIFKTEGAQAVLARAEDAVALAPGHNAEETPIRRIPDGFEAAFGRRRYRVLGLERRARSLKATVRTEHDGRLHADTIDFYSARSRRHLTSDLCRLFEETTQVVEADIARLVRLCENFEPQSGTARLDDDPAAALTAAERREARSFGKRPDLADQILSDFETCGLVGERANKLLCYLAAVSRKTDEPISVMILSSSGAGKTALQDATLELCPPEDVVKLTTVTSRALFYKRRHSLRHKILALEEGAGAEDATYAIRNLISARKLVIETTVKDHASGRMTTMENRVEGPCAVFLTTTDPDTDPETRSRFFVIGVDETREQTRAILASQRRRQTLEGRAENLAKEDTLRRHRNFQRLLEPLLVINPYAERLAFSDDRLQSRRDQPKYLNLIRAVAFLRQMQKKLKKTEQAGAVVSYIEVDPEDIRIADELATEILGRTLDDLNGVSRDLLMQLDAMVEAKAEELKERNGGHAPRRTEITFTRREIRSFSGWSHTRVTRHIRQLIDLEYVLIDSARRGAVQRYHLAYEGQGKDGKRFVLGIGADPCGPCAALVRGVCGGCAGKMLTQNVDVQEERNHDHEKPRQRIY